MYYNINSNFIYSNLTQHCCASASTKFIYKECNYNRVLLLPTHNAKQALHCIAIAPRCIHSNSNIKYLCICMVSWEDMTSYIISSPSCRICSMRIPWPCTCLCRLWRFHFTLTSLHNFTFTRLQDFTPETCTQRQVTQVTEEAKPAVPHHTTTTSRD